MALQQALPPGAARNALDSAELDDVIMGCVDPVGEQGADIARLGDFGGVEAVRDAYRNVMRGEVQVGGE